MADRRDFDQILNNCLEALDAGEELAEVLSRYPQASDDLKELLEAAAWFGGQKAALEPRPGFIPSSRRRLVERLAAEPVATSDGWLAGIISGLRGGWRVALQVTLAVVMLACLFAGGSGVAFASQDALPGDRLYPVKTSLEAAELLLTFDPAAKIELHNQFALTRLAEIQELVMEGRFNYIREAVSNFEAHITHASQLLSILAQKDPQKALRLAVALKETLASQRSFLGVLMAMVPPEVTPEILRAFSVAASGETAFQAALDQAESAVLLAATATAPTEHESDPTATAGHSRPSPTPTPLPTSTRRATSTATATRISATVTPTRTALFTPTRTLPPTITPTPIVEQGRPTPTFTPRPPTSTPVPGPEKTKKPPPDPTRRPPKSPNQGK